MRTRTRAGSTTPPGVRNRRFARPTVASDQESLLTLAIARAKEGDPGAFNYLFARHADDVYAYVNSIVRNHHEAEDITQNVFAKLMGAILKYEQRDVPFAAWILRVARNAALDHMRARRLVPCEEVRVSEEGFDESSLDRVHCLREALEELPEDQREVLVLRHIAGLSPSEIADRLGKTESSVHGLHHRGRRAVRSTLAELESTPVTATA